MLPKLRWIDEKSLPAVQLHKEIVEEIKVPYPEKGGYRGGERERERERERAH